MRNKIIYYYCRFGYWLSRLAIWLLSKFTQHFAHVYSKISINPMETLSKSFDNNIHTNENLTISPTMYKDLDMSFSKVRRSDSKELLKFLKQMENFNIERE